MTSQVPKRATFMLAALSAVATSFAAGAASAQGGGSDRMPGGVEARPSEPETFRRRGIGPPPAPITAPKPKATETVKPPTDKTIKSAPKPGAAVPESAPPTTSRSPAQPGTHGSDKIPGGVEHKPSGD